MHPAPIFCEHSSSCFFSFFSVITLCCEYFPLQPKATNLIIHLCKYFQISLVRVLQCPVSSQLRISHWTGFPSGWSLLWEMDMSSELPAKVKLARNLKRLKWSNCFCVSPQWLKGGNILKLQLHFTLHEFLNSKAVVDLKRHHIRWHKSLPEGHLQIVPYMRILQCVINWHILTGLNAF